MTAADALTRYAEDYQQARAERGLAYAKLTTAIRYAYSQGMTYQAIGEAVGLTRQRVAKICDPRLSTKDGDK